MSVSFSQFVYFLREGEEKKNISHLSSADEKRMEEEMGSPEKSKNHGRQSHGKQTFSGLKHNG